MWYTVGMSAPSGEANVKVRMPREMADALGRIASETDRSISAEIRLAIRAHISSHNATRKGDQR